MPKTDPVKYVYLIHSPLSFRMADTSSYTLSDSWHFSLSNLAQPHRLVVFHTQSIKITYNNLGLQL